MVLHPQAVRAMAEWAEMPSVTDTDFDLLAARAEAHAAGLAEDREPVEAVFDVAVGGVPCRLYRPQHEAAGVVVHLHGGGFVFGDLETHDAHCRRLANRGGLAVLTVDYRRAPEHPYPAASDDVDAVLGGLPELAASHRLDPTRVLLLGDSAGGQLALVAALRNAGITALALVYPCLDPQGGFASYTEEVGGLSAEEMNWYWNAYLPHESDRSRPEIAPLAADPAQLSALPPTLVLTAEHDPLRDEGDQLVRVMADVGVDVTLRRMTGMVHGFFRVPALFDDAEPAQRLVMDFLRDRAR